MCEARQRQVVIDDHVIVLCDPFEALPKHAFAHLRQQHFFVHATGQTQLAGNLQAAAMRQPALRPKHVQGHIARYALPVHIVDIRRRIGNRQADRKAVAVEDAQPAHQ